MSEPPALILDANILIDVLVFKNSKISRPSVELLKKIGQGKFKAIVPAPVLLEVYDRVLHYTHDVKKAEEALAFILNATNSECCPILVDHSLMACEIYKETNYAPSGSGLYTINPPDRLSAVDGHILAIGRFDNKPVCSREKKFKNVQSVVCKFPEEF